MKPYFDLIFATETTLVATKKTKPYDLISLLIHCTTPISWHFGLPCLCPERARYVTPVHGGIFGGCICADRYFSRVCAGSPGGVSFLLRTRFTHNLSKFPCLLFTKRHAKICIDVFPPKNRRCSMKVGFGTQMTLIYPGFRR